MRNARLKESQTGITSSHNCWEKYQQFRYADNTTLMAESEEELRSLLMKVKEHSVKTGLKHYIQKTKIMVYSPITSGQIDGGKVEAVTELIFLVSKITVDGECGMKLRHLLLGRKAMTNLDSAFKNRDRLKNCIQKTIRY